jgi:hypothetical protein
MTNILHRRRIGENQIMPKRDKIESEYKRETEIRQSIEAMPNDLSYKILMEIAGIVERTYRRGFHHGFLATTAVDSRVYKWRYESNADAATCPPGARQTVALLNQIERLKAEIINDNEPNVLKLVEGRETGAIIDGLIAPKLFTNRLLKDLMQVSERAYRRGFQHGHLAQQGKMNAESVPTVSAVKTWRDSSDWRDTSLNPPGTKYSGSREGNVYRLHLETKDKNVAIQTLIDKFPKERDEHIKDNATLSA